jgi:hypothetical protein
MSIEMKNPKTAVEKIDAAANLVGQMYLAHQIKDEKHFQEVHKKASKLLFDALQQLQNDGEGNVEG